MSEDAPARDTAALAAATRLLAWPFIATALAGDAMAEQARIAARLIGGAPDEPAARPEWSAPNRVRLELATMDLRDFSRTGEGVQVLVCAPFALHGADIVDLAPGHSLVETLASQGCGRLFVTDWRSATPEMRLLTIDSYLADLNVAVDEIGAPADLIGLCQGGWMALVYAARFPGKVRRLVLAGAPVDTRAAPSPIASAARHVPLGVFDEIVRLGDGRLLGCDALQLWEPALQSADVAAALQVSRDRDFDRNYLVERFRRWSAAVVDLPGPLYRQAVLWLFRENRLAAGRFVALGRTVDLGAVRHPLFLLAAHDDEVVPPAQLFALQRLAGTRPADIRMLTVAGGHLSLFLGADTLRDAWIPVAHWLVQDSST
jgi:poly(3-hydroxyalkanoate) synthetase